MKCVNTIVMLKF